MLDLNETDFAILLRPGHQLEQPFEGANTLWLGGFYVNIVGKKIRKKNKTYTRAGTLPHAHARSNTHKAGFAFRGALGP